MKPTVLMPALAMWPTSASAISWSFWVVLKTHFFLAVVHGQHHRGGAHR